MKGDWIKLHRKSLDSAVFSDSWLWHLWSWCLMKANFRDGFFQGEPVKRGQFVTGRKTGSESLGVTESKWYRGMQKLEEFGNIKMAPNNRFTVVTVVNYSVYQVFEPSDRTTDEQPANNQRTTDEQPANTIEERKESKKEKKEKNKPVQKPDEVSETSWNDWISARKAKRGCAVTQTVMNAVQREAKINSVSLEYAIATAAERNWMTYKAEWDQDNRNGNGKPSTNHEANAEQHRANQKAPTTRVEMKARNA